MVGSKRAVIPTPQGEPLPPCFRLVPWNFSCCLRRDESRDIDVNKTQNRSRAEFCQGDSDDDWTLTEMETASSYDSLEQPEGSRALHPTCGTSTLAHHNDTLRDALLVADYTPASTTTLPQQDVEDVLFHDAHSELDVPDVTKSPGTALTAPLTFATTAATQFTKDLWNTVMTVLYLNVLFQFLHPSRKSMIESSPTSPQNASTEKKGGADHLENTNE